METFLTTSPEETEKIAEKIGAALTHGDVVTLTGELGAGKTLFSRGIAKGMGIMEEITSPTFSLLEIYEGEEGEIELYHFDLYRIESDDELEELYFEDYWEGNGVSIIEWPLRAGDRLPARRTDITIEYINSTTRRITIEYTGH